MAWVDLHLFGRKLPPIQPAVDVVQKSPAKLFSGVCRLFFEVETEVDQIP
jgi:hypothetical protein